MDLVFGDDRELGPVEATLLAQADRIHMPAGASERILDGILRSAPAPQHRRLIRLAPAWAIPAAVIVAATALGWWRMPAVRARALVTSAEAGLPSATILDTLHMVSTDQERLQSGQACSMRVELWWRAPNAWKVERSGTCGPDTIAVSNGGAVVQYDASTGDMVDSSSLNSAAPLPTAEITQVLMSSWPQATARVLGRTHIDGHLVSEVELQPAYRHAFSATWPGVDEGKSILWIDPNSNLVLRAEAYTTEGEVWFSSEPETVAYNAPVSASDLQFTPPAGAHLVPGTSPEGSKGRSVPWGPLTMADARSRASVPILAPAVVPSGVQVVLEGPLTGTVDHVTMVGYDSAGHDVLDISEQPSASVDMSAMPTAMQQGTALAVDGQEGHQYAGAHVWWNVAGVWITVGSDEQVPGALSLAQVMQVANGMSATASPTLSATIPPPTAGRWKVWVPTDGPPGLPLGHGTLDGGRSLVQFTQTWSWPNTAYAQDVVVREVPAHGLADGPIPEGTQVPGIGPWPTTSPSTVKIGPVSATLSLFQPDGAPQVLTMHLLTLVRDGTAIQITAQGVADAEATILRIARSMAPRTADGAAWADG